jgi:hypothetical protein
MYGLPAILTHTSLSTNNQWHFDANVLYSSEVGNERVTGTESGLEGLSTQQ